MSSIPDKLEKAKAKLVDLEGQRDAAKEEVCKPFKDEQELKAKSARLAELDAILSMDNQNHSNEQDLSSGQDAMTAGYVAESSEENDKGSRPSVLAELKEYGTLSRSGSSHPKPCVEVL